MKLRRERGRMSEPSFHAPISTDSKKNPLKQEHYLNCEECESKSVKLPYWDPLKVE